MGIKIRRYEKDDENALIELIRSEGDEWADYCENSNAIEKFKAVLNDSIVYVACIENTLCGFIRAKDDGGYGIYIYDLLVHKNYRGNSYGRLLIEQINNDFSDAVYVMSDVDTYYTKQGYKKIGSVYTIRE